MALLLVESSDIMAGKNPNGGNTECCVRLVSLCPLALIIIPVLVDWA